MTSTVKLFKHWRNHAAAWLSGLFLLVLVGVGIWLLPRPQAPITNFDQCVKAGYPVQESYPAVCRISANRTYVQKIKSSGAESHLPFTALVTSSNLPGADSSTHSIAIRKETEWQAIWQQVNAHSNPIPTLPPIDFTKDMVALVALGQRSTGGYAIQVKSITQLDARLVINSIELEPGNGCGVTQALTSPYTIVKFERSDKPVEFKLATQTKDCSAIN